LFRCQRQRRKETRRVKDALGATEFPKGEAREDDRSATITATATASITITATTTTTQRKSAASRRPHTRRHEIAVASFALSAVDQPQKAHGGGRCALPPTVGNFGGRAVGVGAVGAVGVFSIVGVAAGRGRGAVSFQAVHIDQLVEYNNGIPIHRSRPAVAGF